MKHLYLMVALCLVLGACGESSSNNNSQEPQGEDMGAEDDLGPQDMGEDAAMDMPQVDMEPENPCAPVGHREDGLCVAEIGWSAGPSLPVARDHHATVLVEEQGQAWLMVFGGARDSAVEVLDDIVAAPILEDGGVGPWQVAGQLPTPSAGHVVTLQGDDLWISGGIVPRGDSFTFTDQGYHCKLDRQEMQVGACEAMPSTFRWHHQMFVRQGYVYDLGGVGFSDERVDTVRRAAIGDGGQLGVWEPMEPLPVPLSHHGLAHTEGSVYVVGGLTPDGGSRKVYRADFTQQGAIEAWTEELPLSGVRITPATAIVGDWLFVISGLTEDPDPEEAFLYTSLRGALRPEGGVGRWEMVEAVLPQQQSHVHQTPVWKQHLYVLGGRTSQRQGNAFLSTAAVSVGKVE